MLKNEYDNLKLSYRKIFLETANEVYKIIESLKPDNFEGDIFACYEINSEGFNWQQSVMKQLSVMKKENLTNGLSQIGSYRLSSRCVGCGVCCKFAVSEFSYDDLKLKAEDGDKFAAQFISIFVPYENSDELEHIYPEYVKLLKDNEGSGYYFYHCPKVTEDNRCPDYESRPQICRDFPDNPIAFLPKTCGYKDWKLKSESVSLKLNAEAEIINFYISKIKDLY